MSEPSDRDDEPATSADDDEQPKASDKSEETASAPAKRKARDASARAARTRRREREAREHVAPEVALAPVAEEPRKSRTLFWILGGVAVAVAGAAGWYFLRDREEPWKVGEEVDVQITLVAADRTNLACAAPQEVGGKRCGFEAKDKPGKAGADPETVLIPYTTVDKKYLLAAGLWSQLGKDLPTERFPVRCKFKIEGLVPKPAVRWEAKAPWVDTNADWFAGTVSSCVVLK